MAAFEEELPYDLLEINEEGVRDFLSSISWPQGFQDFFIRNLQMFPIRFVICDDSGSVLQNLKLVEILPAFLIHIFCI